MKLSVVIPVYNELDTIEMLLERVMSVGLADEIIIIDDGSTDGTRKLLQELAPTHEIIHLILHETNQGKGAAVQTGFQAATGDLILFWHMIANKMLTLMTNLLYNSILTDMETGYKLFKSEIIKDIPLRSKRFNIEPEITAKLLKRKVRIFEVPITFNPREYEEGKKIGLGDAFEAVWSLIKYRFMD
jgi:glycosyltransferase involved in cell wall biosynthesis